MNATSARTLAVIQRLRSGLLHLGKSTKLIVLAASIPFLGATMSQAEARPHARHFMQGEQDLLDVTNYGDNAEAGHYVQAGDAKLYYEVYGEGEPIILLHGGVFGSSFEMYQFADKLVPDHQVIVMSTRGHGRSEIGSEPVTFEQRATDVLAVMDEVTDQPFTILGFSDGAYTGYKVAAMFPDRVKKLVAIGAGEQVPGLRQVVLDWDAAYQYDPIYWDFQMTLMPEPARQAEHWADLAEFYNSMVADKALFQSIKAPVLVLSGERDMNAPLATVIAAYQMIPDSRLSVIPDAPHPVFLVNFPAVWSAIEPFLKS